MFDPIPPNFYSRTAGAGRPSIGARQVQNISTANNTLYTARNKQTKYSPGTSFNQRVTANAVNIQPFVDIAIDSIADAITDFLDPVEYDLYNPMTLDPSANRLASNGLPEGGIYSSGRDADPVMNQFSPSAAFTDKTEYRAIISDQTGLFINSGGIFAPLSLTGGVLFPYTPQITVNHSAKYEMENLVHSNYSIPYYTHSTVDSIQVQARFTAQTPGEARYIMAMIHFFRSVTKMFYGKSSNKGTPPPVLFFDAHGQYMFDHIPVVISSFSYSLPIDVNYISTNIATSLNNVNASQQTSSKVMVPVDLNVTIDMIPTYSRANIAKNFSLNDFAAGSMIGSGTGKRPGGWI